MKSILAGVVFAAGLSFSMTAQAEQATQTEQAQTPQAAQRRFEASDQLEDLRYKHLWIAYGIIWLSVFGFVLRTWKRSQETARELDGLKARLAELESGDE